MHSAERINNYTREPHVHYYGLYTQIHYYISGIKTLPSGLEEKGRGQISSTEEGFQGSAKKNFQCHFGWFVQ
jgi:hypothetical protein